MAASQSECLAISGDENGDSNGLISDSNEKGNDPIKPNNQLSIIGQELSSGIINQYGQLVGEYSKLDDELWLPNSEEGDDAGEMWNDGLGYEIVASHEKLIDIERPLAISWEPLSGYVEHSVSDGHIAPVEDNSCTLKNSSENQFQTPSPVSVLKRKRSYSNAKGSMPSQNKYRQPTKDSSSGGPRFSGSTNPNGEQSQADQSGSEYSMESSLSDETEEPVPLQKVRTRKISDLLYSNHSNQAVKKCCLHCETTETPQWRTGPMGRKTLCNACGVQYKHGRLFADYRPLRSPTFDPALHFSVPKKVQELRMGYPSEKGPNVASKTKIIKEKKKANKIREEDPTFIPKLKKVKGMRKNNRYERNPYPTFKPNKVQELRMDKTYEIDLNTTPDCNNVEEMRMDNDNGMGPNLAAEPRRSEETRMGNNSNMGQNLVSEHKSVEEVSGGNNNAREESCAQRANNIHNSTERASNWHDSDSYVRNKNVESGLIQRRKQKVSRKCTHCASTETPQWREGPEGRFTLCNACGVQYRNGRLFPEYRPLKSPTYDPLLHSHLPKKVQEMRMRMGIAEKSVTSGNCQDQA